MTFAIGARAGANKFGYGFNGSAARRVTEKKRKFSDESGPTQQRNHASPQLRPFPLLSVLFIR